jgi:hypothetical protein
MILEMRRDIHPICDKDHGPMRYVVYDMPNIGLSNIRLFACATTGCTRHFEHGRGYFDVIEHRFRPDPSATRIPCPNCTVPMFLEDTTPAGDERWRCAQVSCDNSRDRNPQSEYQRFQARVFDELDDLEQAQQRRVAEELVRAGQNVGIDVIAEVLDRGKSVRNVLDAINERNQSGAGS